MQLESGNTRSCLVANDEPFLLSLLDMQLKRQFDDVVCVCDGQQAVDAVLAHAVDHFSMIILDINMPGKNGMQACEEIVDFFKKYQKYQIEQDECSSNKSARSPHFFSNNLLSNQKRKKSMSMSEHSSGSFGHHSERKSRISRSIKSVVRRQCPKIFALTSDIDEQKIKHYQAIGFDNVCKCTLNFHYFIRPGSLNLAKKLVSKTRMPLVRCLFAKRLTNSNH